MFNSVAGLFLPRKVIYIYINTTSKQSDLPAPCPCHPANLLLVFTCLHSAPLGEKPRDHRLKPRSDAMSRSAPTTEVGLHQGRSTRRSHRDHDGRRCDLEGDQHIVACQVVALEVAAQIARVGLGDVPGRGPQLEREREKPFKAQGSL